MTAKLPQTDAATDDQKIERSSLARDFIQSAAYAYMVDMIDRQITTLKLEILDLSRKNTDRFMEIKCEISCLERLKSSAQCEEAIGNRLLERRKQGK